MQTDRQVTVIKLLNEILTFFFFQARQAELEGLGERAVLLQAYLGLAWALGCVAFGLLVVHNSVECRIARQYLCQVSSHAYLKPTTSIINFLKISGSCFYVRFIDTSIDSRTR